MNPLTDMFTDERRAVIGLRIMLNVDQAHPPITQFMFPDRNRVATNIMRRLLVARLNAEGVGVAESNSTFPFNWSSYLFVLQSREMIGKAIEVIYQEVRQVGVDFAAQVGWFDIREG